MTAASTHWVWLCSLPKRRNSKRRRRNKCLLWHFDNVPLLISWSFLLFLWINCFVACIFGCFRCILCSIKRTKNVTLMIILYGMEHTRVDFTVDSPGIAAPVGTFSKDFIAVLGSWAAHWRIVFSICVFVQFYNFISKNLVLPKQVPTWYRVVASKKTNNFQLNYSVCLYLFKLNVEVIVIIGY